MKGKQQRSKMEEEAEKAKRSKSNRPMQVYSVNSRGRQRPPEAKAKRHCGKAPTRFSAVRRAGLCLWTQGCSSLFCSHCLGRWRS